LDFFGIFGVCVVGVGVGEVKGFEFAEDGFAMLARSGLEGVEAEFDGFGYLDWSQFFAHVGGSLDDWNVC
jgi:hypothetical protein